ncbi:MAG: MMPL family transporter, partial [Myxococcota bacterium]|nr:MMPL family transporter [Myxococcota bacterium]
GIPILVGIGVDVIIHLLHRMSEEGPGHILRALQTTGWAAALSTATTVLSFASLSVASSQGIRSLGILIVLGLTTVTVAAFVAVPLGWMTTWKIRGQLPQDLIED